MSHEAWVANGDDIDNFNGNKPWPDQVVTVDGVQTTLPVKQEYRLGNRSVPMARHRDEFIDAVGNNPVVLLEGDMGTGKTTLGAQALLESGVAKKVIQAQPRIVLTRNAAYRLRQEIAYANQEPHSADHLVGYSTSTEVERHKSNEIIIGTYGTVLKWAIHGSSELRDAVVMADEIHLREWQADLLMATCAKNGIQLVISSGTMDTDKTARTFESKGGTLPPIISVQGREHELTYLAPHKDGLIDDIVKYSKMDTAIFLPGRRDIDRTMSQSLRKMPTKINGMALHGQQTKDEQQRVFDQSKGVRGIFSTNVGEMGLTFDVDMVINPGYEKTMKLIDGVRTLAEEVASKANNRQRAGRAGRTRPGFVVEGSKMDGYPKLPPAAQIPEYASPAILTTYLDSALLQLSAMDETFDTLPMMDKPDMHEVERALVRLRRIGALDDNNKMTSIGKKMEQYPVDPNYARMIVEAEQYEAEFPSIRAQLAALAAVQQTQGIMKTDSGADMWRNVIPNDGDSDLIFGMNLYMWAADPKRTEEEHRLKGIIEPSFLRAQQLFTKMCETQNIDPSLLKSPTTPVEKEALIACIVSGVEEVFVRNGKESYRDIRGDRRQLQSATTVGKSPIVIGSPWNLQAYRAEVLTTQRYVSEPTAVTREQLVSYAPHRCTYDVHGYDMDKWGNITAKRALYFDGQYINDVERVSVEAGGMLRDYLVDSLFHKSIHTKKELPANVTVFCNAMLDLEYTQHKADFNLEAYIQLESVREALKSIVPETVMSLQNLDEYLSLDLLDSAFDQEIIQEVKTRAPDILSIAGENGEAFDVAVEYHNNQARLSFSRDQLDYLPESFPELHGRDVMVKIDGRSRLHTVEDAFDRALHPNRDHWRNNVRKIDSAPSSKRRKDEDWDGSSVSIQDPSFVQKWAGHRRTQSK